MRIIIVGMGVQGRKRAAIAGDDVVAVVDPIAEDADFKTVGEVAIDSYEAALVCAPDREKASILSYLIDHRKHVLVEKPFPAETPQQVDDLAARVADAGTAFYTAYNHRFEPNVRRMHDLLCENALGALYSARLFYGNGTAQLVRDSAWRDQGNGVIGDLGSHLMDMAIYWFGELPAPFTLYSVGRHENRAPDRAWFGAGTAPALSMEVSMMSWRNEFFADIYGELGSAHIRSLGKWGPTTFIHRERVFPSGRPEETEISTEAGDPTWQLEYDHFRALCAERGNNLQNDRMISAALRDLSDY